MGISDISSYPEYNIIDLYDKSCLCMKDKLKKFNIFLTPAGAGIAIICFFLPWVRVSCGTITVEASGARIGGVLWLVLTAAVVILAAFIYLYLRRRRELFRVKLIASISSATAIIIMLYKFISAFAGDGGSVRLSDIWPVIRFGAIGEFLGFIMAMGGSMTIGSNRTIEKIGARRKFSYLNGVRGYMTRRKKTAQNKNSL